MPRREKRPVVKESDRPRVMQNGREVQPFGTVTRVPIALDVSSCAASVTNLNQVLADTLMLRDLYKKHYWHVGGPTFPSLHLLFDKHHGQQAELADTLAERIHSLGGVAIAMSYDVAEVSLIPRPPRGREEVPAQVSRLLHAHEVILKEARPMAQQASRKGDDGTNDLLVSDVIRLNEMQVWLLREHLVDMPLIHQDSVSRGMTAV